LILLKPIYISVAVSCSCVDRRLLVIFSAFCFEGGGEERGTAVGCLQEGDS